MTNEKTWKLRRSVMFRVKREDPAEGHEFDGNLQEATNKVLKRVSESNFKQEGPKRWTGRC